MEKDGFTVLYVDDEVHNLISFNATFRKEYRILTAGSGREGLEVLRTEKVHLVICDQRMPEMTGVEFLEKIKEDYPDTIRMIITGFSDIDAVIGAINRGGVYRYITKPWDEREMRVTINNAKQLSGLQEENIASQFETLKNQVNPHFLFNSLNVLSSLIYIDRDKAARFVRQLSAVYRYVLDYKDKSVIELREELPFLESYIFLLQTRFDTSLSVSVNIAPGQQDKMIVPMTLQILFENAIKHNVVSKSKPLSISVNAEDNKLVVRNNLQLKTSKEPSAGIGLENLRKRYNFLSGRKIEVVSDKEYFTVTVPLLEITYGNNESVNY